MQLNIAICDDFEEDRQRICELLQLYSKEHALIAHLTTFSSGEDFVEAQKNVPFDIVFMDIYMDDMKGTDAIAACSSESMRTVFTTTSREYAIEAFHLNASHYLLKPLTYESISDAMARCLASRDTHQLQYLTLKTTQGLVSLPAHQILYVEVKNKICTIHTERSSFQTYSSLNAMFELLDIHTFMRAQRSYIVNMNYIESFYFDRIVLSNGKEIMLSRTMRGELKKQYQHFLFHMAKEGCH